MSDRQFQICGKKFSVQEKLRWTFQPLPGGWYVGEALRPDGYKIRERFCLRLTDNGQSVSAHIGGQSIHAQLIDQSTAYDQAGGEIAVENQLTAQFPGKVRQALVKAGQNVTADQCLLKVEAMKMEFEIKAPRAGCVKKISVTDGQQINPGDIYLELEKEGQA